MSLRHLPHVIENFKQYLHFRLWHIRHSFNGSIISLTNILYSFNNSLLFPKIGSISKKEKKKDKKKPNKKTPQKNQFPQTNSLIAKSSYFNESNFHSYQFKKSSLISVFINGSYITLSAKSWILFNQWYISANLKLICLLVIDFLGFFLKKIKKSL